MKKKKYLLPFTVILILIRCGYGDPARESYYVWVNKSDHTITFTLDRFDPLPDREDFLPVTDEKTLESNGQIELTGGGMAYSPPPSDLFDKMTITFHDGTEVVYCRRDYVPPHIDLLPLPESYNKQYDPTFNSNYVQEDVKNGTRWTYTFTNADYEAAVRMSEAQEVREGE